MKPPTPQTPFKKSGLSENSKFIRQVSIKPASTPTELGSAIETAQAEGWDALQVSPPGLWCFRFKEVKPMEVLAKA